SFQAPILIERAGPSTRKKFFEFFTVRSATRTHEGPTVAIQQFLAWSDRAGYQDLEDIEPITVAAYIETLQRQATIFSAFRDSSAASDALQKGKGSWMQFYTSSLPYFIFPFRQTTPDTILGWAGDSENCHSGKLFCV